MKNLKPLADKFATFAKIIDDGQVKRVVILTRSDEFAIVRPVHEFHVMIRVRANQLFEAF